MATSGLPIRKHWKRSNETVCYGKICKRFTLRPRRAVCCELPAWCRMSATMREEALDRSRWHAPQDRATLRAAAVELAARGLTLFDIAEALRLSEAAVRDFLGIPTCGASHDRA